MATDWKASLPKKRISKRFKFSGNSRSLGNTGAGENGVVEPSKPTAMFQTALGPRMVHEGENMTQRPNGDVEVQPVTQSALAQMEKQRKIPGYEEGGVFTPVRPPRPSEKGPPQTALGTPSLPQMPSNKGGPFTAPAPTLNLGAPVVNTPEQQTVQPPPAGPQTTTDVGLNVGDPITGAPVAGEAPPAPPTPQGLGIGDQAVAKGLGGLEAIAAGESPVDRTIANRTLGNMSAQQEAERMAAIQAQAQQGVTGPAAQAQQAMLGITQGSQMGQTAGQLAIGAQERAGAAIRDMATVGLQKSQQDYKKQSDQIASLISAGGPENLAAAGQAFSDLYGVNLDTSRLSSAEGQADFTTGMENLTSFIASGQSFDEALDGMRANGTLDLLGLSEPQARSLYDSMKLNTDPVYRAMNAFGDDTLATMFPDLDPAEARSTIGRMHLMGIGTLDEDGNFQIDYGMLADLGFTTSDPNNPSDPPNVPEQEGFDSFTETIPTGEEGQWTYRKWVAEGRPTDFDSTLDPDEGEADFSDLFITTGGNLFNVDNAQIQEIATAILGGDETATEQFGVPDDALNSLLVNGALSTNVGSDNIADVFIPDNISFEVEDLVGHVVTETPETLASRKADKLIAEGKITEDQRGQYIADYTEGYIEQFGSGAQTWVITESRMSRSGSGGTQVTFRNPVTGETRTVDFLTQESS